jgi:hypothetical protein
MAQSAQMTRRASSQLTIGTTLSCALYVICG